MTRMLSHPRPYVVNGHARIGIVDAIRGAAILLMVLDHVLFQLDPHSTLRAGAPWSITRLSLPLFMLAAAGVWRRSPDGIRPRLLAAVVPELVLLDALGMPTPGIVMLVALTFLGLDCWPAHREPPWYVLGALGLIQALYVPIGWGGYEPGLVLLWFALGRLAWVAQPFPNYGQSPRWAAWLESVGRRPLLWYLGHLFALVPVGLTYGVSPW